MFLENWKRVYSNSDGDVAMKVGRSFLIALLVWNITDIDQFDSFVIAVLQGEVSAAKCFRRIVCIRSGSKLSNLTLSPYDSFDTNGFSIWRVDYKYK